MPPRPNAEATGQPAWVLGRGCHQETLQPSTALCSFCASAFKVGSDLCLIPKMALAEFMQLINWTLLLSLGDTPEVESCQCLSACSYKHPGFIGASWAIITKSVL